MRFLVLFFLTFPFLMLARDNPFTPVTESAITKEKTTEPETKAVTKPKIHPQRRQTKAKLPVTAKKEPTVHPQHRPQKKEIVNTSKARFVFSADTLYIETKDKVIKHFAIANPPSIVIDFKGYSDFASKRKALTVEPFVKLEMGSHGDRYRVVIRLDKTHKYKVNRGKYGQVVTILD